MLKVSQESLGDLFLQQKTGKRLPCLHEQTFAGRKNMECVARNVRMRDRVGGSSYSILNILFQKSGSQP